MAEPYHGGLSKDLAFTSSSQHSTDYFHNIIHSFQGDNRHLISTQQIYNSSAIDTVGHNSEVILDWPSLLRWRESEARDFAASACDEDKQLIRLYLPPLRRKYAQNSQSDSSPDCHWTPPVVDSSKQAAHIIVSHLFGHFREVSFTEVVEGAYGNSSKSTERLYACARHINHWYQSSTELQSKYKHILYELVSQHPFAHHIVSSCSESSSYHKGLGLIYAPIQDLLADEQLSVIEVFKRFALLKVRYEGAQSSEPLETWDGQLSCDFTFLDKIVSVDPWEFVRAITDKHQELFLALRDEDYPHSDRLSSIIRGGECLSNYVAECALTKDSLAEKMSQIEIILWLLRNYYAAFAFHIGLEKAKKLYNTTLIFDRIVGSEDNYRCYRQHWDDAPGLPHIYPHIYGQYSEEKKQDFFRFHEYVEWRSRGKEDNLTSHVNQNSDIPSAPRRPPQHYFPRLIFSSHNHAASTQSHLHLENGSQYEPHSQRRTCPTGLYSALTVLRREMQSWTCCNSGGFSARGPDHKLGVDSQWVTTKLDALKTPWRRSDIDRCQSKLPDTKHSQTPRSIASPSSSYASASRDPGEDSPIHNAHRLPYSGIAAKREPPVDNATLGMTDGELRESYTFLHLSNVIRYKSDVPLHLDGKLGDLQDILSVLELPDETWELTVHRQYVTELCRKLKTLFPVCHVHPDYDPIEPTSADIQRFHSYDVAKWQKESAFFDREQSMRVAWPTAAKYYNLRAKDIRSGAPAAAKI